MSTPLFNGMVIEVSNRLKDARTDPTTAGDAGHRYTSDLLSYYLNESVRNFLSQQYATLTPEKFGDVFPEYMVNTGGIAFAGNVLGKPSEALFVKDVIYPGFNFTKIKDEAIVYMLEGRDPLNVPSLNAPYFYVQGQSVFILPTNWPTLSSAISAALRYIQTHQDVTPSMAGPAANDIPLNPTWFQTIIPLAVAMGEADAVRMT